MASRKTEKSFKLLLNAILGDTEVEDIVEDVKLSHYSLSLYVADDKVAESTKSKLRSSVIKCEWKANNQIWFKPSSAVKFELYRKYRYGNIPKVLAGKHEGKVVDLLENDTSFDLTDKKGDPAAKMKIVLSRITRSGDDMGEFMKMRQVFNLTKAIMDKISAVVQEQDDSIQEVADTLLEMLATAEMIPDFQLRRSFMNIRIDKCQKDCASLKDSFYRRLHLDTNIQAKRIRTLNATMGDKLGAFELDFSINCSRNLNEARDKRLVNTYAWFLEGKRFRLWQEKPDFLWIKGKPGCGKSILWQLSRLELHISSSTEETLRKNYRGTPPQLGMCRFIFPSGRFQILAMEQVPEVFIPR